ncbi:preprotein translocase subunit SecE [Bacterioplanoides sp. SCSIO 12839]|uniref:preprotein translocase subunit SecE n=1 Tax=Bacterioplanoides sp. SCSIO 12839 TaxID=2829569 RepID=UPI002105E402|nr:preprotein translocase subunit SecE [Bacterioplanoides sp. SCSIO 12839]UTW48473.1 preprotein translocase subunit SecE [Bacterioplanoides sp. SCSIO 12839]
MSTESKANNSPLDIVKWLVAIALFAAAVVGNYMAPDLYLEAQGEELPLLFQVLAVVALMLLSAGAALTTAKGQAFLQLLKEANIERRKVVWPTRQETTQTTMIVVVVVFVMALILWGLDSLLGWLVSLIVG